MRVMPVMSDWEAAHSSLSIMRGLDQEMPGWGGAGPAMGTSSLMARLANHTITRAAIAENAERVLRAMFSVGLMDAPPGTFGVNGSKLQANVSGAASIASARALCAGSTVLLKNAGRLLPLRKQGVAAARSVAVIGMAQATDAIITGGGSGGVHPSWHGVAAPLTAIAQQQAASGGTTHFGDGSDINASAALAAQADVAVLFVGTFSGEGADRQSLSLDHVHGKGSGVRLAQQNALVPSPRHTHRPCFLM